MFTLLHNMIFAVVVLGNDPCEASTCDVGAIVAQHCLSVVCTHSPAIASAMAHPDLVLQISTSLSTLKPARRSGVFLLPVLDYQFPCYGSDVGVVTHIYADLTGGIWKLIEHHGDKQILLGYCQQDSALAGAPWQLIAAFVAGSIQIHSRSSVAAVPSSVLQEVVYIRDANLVFLCRLRVLIGRFLFPLPKEANTRMRTVRKLLRCCLK